MKLQIPTYLSTQISQQFQEEKLENLMKLTLVFKELENFFMKLEELHVKEMKEDGRKLMEAGW